MKLILVREPSIAGTTFGALYLDEAFECFTLEDEIRAFPNKVPKKTCIWGDRTYEVVLDFSPKYGKEMLHVIGVELFDGIRIHSGTDQDDTEGCIIVGRIKSGLTIRESRIARDILYGKAKKVLGQGEKMWITVVNPVEMLEPEGVGKM